MAVPGAIWMFGPSDAAGGGLPPITGLPPEIGITGGGLVDPCVVLVAPLVAAPVPVGVWMAPAAGAGPAGPPVGVAPDHVPAASGARRTSVTWLRVSL
jgi:hypothetical protein